MYKNDIVCTPNVFPKQDFLTVLTFLNVKIEITNIFLTVLTFLNVKIEIANIFFPQKYYVK